MCSLDPRPRSEDGPGIDWKLGNIIIIYNKAMTSQRTEVDWRKYRLKFDWYFIALSDSMLIATVPLATHKTMHIILWPRRSSSSLMFIVPGVISGVHSAVNHHYMYTYTYDPAWVWFLWLNNDCWPFDKCPLKGHILKQGVIQDYHVECVARLGGPIGACTLPPPPGIF